MKRSKLISKLIDAARHLADAQRVTQKSTGQLGKAFAGALFVDQMTGNVGLALRSNKVNNPNIWHTVGGGIDKGENRLTALRREIREELDYDINQAVKTKKLCTHKTDNGKLYTTYVVLVAKPFEFELNDENTQFAWFSFNDLPANIHPQLRAVLRKKKVIRRFAKILCKSPSFDAMRLVTTY